MSNFLTKSAFRAKKLGIKPFPLKSLESHSGKIKEFNFILEHTNSLTLNNDSLILNDLGFSFDIKKVDLEALNDYFSVKDKMRFSIENGAVFAHFSGLKFSLPFPSGIAELKEIFLENAYSGFNVKGKTVVDIGGFIGDTALYFASKGASKIVCYEPAPNLFEYAKRNSSLNGFENIIELHNEAVDLNDGCMTLNYNPFIPGASSAYWGNNRGVAFSVNVKAFEKIISDSGKVGLLKCDCEGAECNFIPDAAKRGILDSVESLVMEVHTRKIENMTFALEFAGFEIFSSVKYDYGGWVLKASKRKG